MTRQIGRAGGIASVVVLSCMMIACRTNQNHSKPTIEFTRVPRAGEGGPDRTDTIAGRVIGSRPGQRIVIFAHWGPWWVQPLVAQPFTIIQPDFRWQNSTHFGTQYAALLVDPNYQPPGRTDILPSTGHGIVAVAVVEGRPVFWQRWWFLLAAMLASAAIVATYFRYRMMRLANEEKRFRQAIDCMPAMAFIARADGYCTFVNRGWVKFTGLTVEQTSGSGWQAAIHPDDLSRFVSKWRRSLASGKDLEHEIRVRGNADGACRWFLIRAVPLRDSRGKILKWFGAATDIEDRKRAEQLQADLTHVSRVSTMGELVASISHELLQPITATITNAGVALRWLQRDPPDLAEAMKTASAIVDSGKRAAAILDHLRSLYKKAPTKREPVAVNEVIREMVMLLRSEANGHAVSIRTDLKDDLPMTLADRVQLQQVLMNLMLNAIEAMADTGGMLTVQSQFGAEGKVQVAVSDTGPGLPPCKVDQLFDAFYTTKPQGSGMGLSISKSIIEGHGGRIWATMNGGATFYFELPPATQRTNDPSTPM